LSKGKDSEDQKVSSDLNIKKTSISVSDSDDSDYNLDESCNSVSDNDSDDSETIIMLKTPMKKPEILDSNK
jgi:hypothetical protein